MNERLSKHGWSCVGVRGFIPPAVFTELQSRKVLAIAADIRSPKTIAYTPAPDIIHESAGHAPILIDSDYASYLQACGEIGYRAIESKEERALFEAVRNLSVVKEDPLTTDVELACAQFRLEASIRAIRYLSESARASRLFWWTAEYGLVGTLERPYLYGAGLLSSLGESEHCLSSAVRKHPLTLACVEMPFDITRMQPQLYVARDFAQLHEVLEEFRAGLSWRKGGDYGLEEALRSGTVNHLVLEEYPGSTVELTGEVTALHRSAGGQGLSTAVVVLRGPTMLSVARQCTESPKSLDAVVVFGEGRLPASGAFEVRLSSGVRASGHVVSGHEVIDFQLWLHGERLPVSGWVNLVVARSVPSVAGRAADPETWESYFGALESFQTGTGERIARQHKADELTEELASLYAELRALRESGSRAGLTKLAERVRDYPDEFILQEELTELAQA